MEGARQGRERVFSWWRGRPCEYTAAHNEGTRPNLHPNSFSSHLPARLSLPFRYLWEEPDPFRPGLHNPLPGPVHHLHLRLQHRDEGKEGQHENTRFPWAGRGLLGKVRVQLHHPGFPARGRKEKLHLLQPSPNPQWVTDRRAAKDAPCGVSSPLSTTKPPRCHV